jgi:hypothetical protein
VTTARRNSRERSLYYALHTVFMSETKHVCWSARPQRLYGPSTVAATPRGKIPHSEIEE